jgi:RecA/RadA recombinase
MSDKKNEENEKKDLTKIANQLKDYMNAQYKEAVAYTPDATKRAAVKVSKWIKMSDEMAEALGMPGLPFGHIMQIYGKKDSGKTSALMDGIVAAQKQGILPILILTEYKFDYERLEKWMGGDPAQLLVLEADTLEQGFGYLEHILRSLRQDKLVIPDSDVEIDMTGTDCYIFWDSIGGTVSQSEMEYDTDEWSKDMGRGAQAIKKLVKRSIQLLHKVSDRTGALFLNQVWGKRTPQGITVDQPQGGEAVQHYYAYELHLKKANSINMQYKGKQMGIGYEIKMDVKKNHINHKRPKTSMCAVAKGIIPKTGIDEFKKEYVKVLKEDEKEK